MGRTKPAELLKELGYSLQGNRKTREGKNHPERDAQFKHIAKRVKTYQSSGRPATSVDTRRKKCGNKANKGQKYRPNGNPLAVDTHDFPDKKLGKAVPDGVDDMAENGAGASVGISSDTASSPSKRFDVGGTSQASHAIQNDIELLITADSGGARSSQPVVET